MKDRAPPDVAAKVNRVTKSRSERYEVGSYSSDRAGSSPARDKF